MKKKVINSFVVMAAVTLAAVATSAETKSAQQEDIPIGQTAKQTSAESIFGTEGGYLHPFLSLAGFYTDNIDNSAIANSDTALIASVGAWLAIPRVKEILMAVATANSSPGGRSMAVSNPEALSRYQLYLTYNADIEEYDNYSENDVINHKVDALAQYNMPVGLAIDLADQYIKATQEKGVGDFTDVNRYDSNLATLTLTYNVSDKTGIKAEYTNFFLDYEQQANFDKNRQDHAGTVYLLYKLSPKTTFFGEYEYIDVTYDTGVISDSNQQHFLGGMKWSYSDKLQIDGKVGLGRKKFAQTGLGEVDELVGELSANYSISPQTSLALTLNRKMNETTMAGSDYTVDRTVGLNYSQMFTDKISAKIGLSYTETSFEGIGQSIPQVDKVYSVSPALNYSFSESISANLSYNYADKTSNTAGSEYTANSVILKFAASF